MNQEVVVITEDQLQLSYEILNKPYMVGTEITIYDEEYSDGTFASIELVILNDGKKFRGIELNYNCDGQHKTVILSYEYSPVESFDELVKNLTNLFETEKFKRLVERENTGGNFEEDKNIVIKTYKSA